MLRAFDLSVNHISVLLHGDTLVLVLHGFHVEVDRWDGRDHFAKLQLILHLLDICIGSRMLRDWLAAALLCDVFLLVLCLVSVAVLWFALPAVGYALVLRAVGFALLGSLHHCYRSSVFFSCGPRTLVALLHSSRHRLVGCGSVCDFHQWLLDCGSFSDSLTTGSLAVVLSVLLLSHFVVESFHRGLLSRRGPLVRATPQWGHRSSCFCLKFFVTSTHHFPFTCADDSCLSLSCTRAAVPTLLNFTSSSFCWMRPPLSVDIRLF